jgi:LysR family transcriptional activator of nhaA
VDVLPAPTAIEEKVKRRHTVGLVGRSEAVREKVYAISTERRIRHPAVIAISEGAQSRLFAERRAH